LIKTDNRNLRVLICDDEYLLAMDMAEQFEGLRADVVGLAGTLGELRRHLRADGFRANAVVLDLQFSDGNAYDVIPLIEETGAAVVICTGFHVEERPREFSHIPWIDKPASAETIYRALRVQLDNRGGVESV
jgi:ActR/RegA family two-component response regulator